MGQSRHFGVWHVLAAVPVFVGSLLLVLIAFAWLGRWEPAALLGWFASGGLLRTRAGERLAVRAFCGFRRPSAAQREALAEVWGRALATCRLNPAGVDLYVQQSPCANAFTAGWRSVAVTS